jgi:hypothetical protein
VGAAAALDQVLLRIDFVGAVDREVEAFDGVERQQRDAGLARRGRPCPGWWHAAHLQALLRMRSASRSITNANVEPLPSPIVLPSWTRSAAA